MSDPKKANHLLSEKSPYLQQHVYNPVDWYPWGEEALSLARKTGRPIFLSIGYSTCHWCHVMEHESFEDKETAALLNKSFVSIKVDREERPDLDAIYMTAVQALTGAGGWPMSVFLTPDLKPFFAGTYFPPDDRYGRPGFPSVLSQLAEIWEKEQHKAVDSAEHISGMLKQSLETRAKAGASVPPTDTMIKQTLGYLTASFDSKNGGFGPAPKFPMPVYLDFLLWHHGRTGDDNSLQMAAFTMRKIAEGGITDHLGGGFARYSTDDKWVVPHFEKMLYDNAQLISVCVSLYEQTGDVYWKMLGEKTIRYVLSDLTHPQGGFYSAEDADSEGKEGTFYLWTLSELKKLLGDDADLVVARYGLSVQGNFFDPHTRETGKNVLVQSQSVPENDRARLEAAEKKMLAARAKRPRPHRDEKVLTEWNGLMLSALARAAVAFESEEFLTAAVKAGDFLWKNLYDTASGRLFRRWREGDRKIDGQQGDYAFLIQSFLDLFEAASDAAWLERALSLQTTHDKLFLDAAGGWFMNVERPDLLVRMKDESDNVIPSGNSVAVSNGFRLTRLTDRPEFEKAARKTLEFFGEKLTQYPASVAKMVTAVGLAESANVHAVIVGPRTDSATGDMLKLARASKIPGKVVVSVEPGAGQEALSKLMPAVGPMKMVDGKPTAYVCRDFACKNPTTNIQSLKSLLQL